MSAPVENLADLASRAVGKFGDGEALRHAGASLTFVELDERIDAFAAALAARGLPRYARVAIYLNKQFETVVAILGTARFGGAFVPVNPVLKPAQVAYILNDCGVRVLVTNKARFDSLKDVVAGCPELEHVVLVDGDAQADTLDWDAFLSAQSERGGFRALSTDMAAIMYTSGSTGSPKGVVLSHSNLTTGAESVASYIGNSPDDRILAALPFSFDAGLSQMTTGLHSGASVVLHDFFLPRDVVRIVEAERITGITGVPPLWIQLAELDWPAEAGAQLRYFANTGGKMPKDTLGRLRQIFPEALPFLMYGLTESFRSTYLPPSEVDARPDSMGKAIPNAEILVINEQGRLCGPGEEGELVHRGPLVSLGYWNDPERTDQRFKPAPGQPEGLPKPELAVWSGDTVRTDEDGFLYFVGRRDEMIKTSGYRVSPTEIEEIAYESGFVVEALALGPKHGKLGQGIVLVAKAADGQQDPTDTLLAEYRRQLPGYMVPLAVEWRDALPRNANGKLDRKRVADEMTDYFQASP